jgi:hypothetical protein
MASTYTVNTGIELITNGEQSGTWGDTTNTNLEIIDRLTNGVGDITITGTTHTLTTSDGALSDGQYKVLVFGGTPSGTNTVTISPNDQEKLYFIVNNSGESIILTQGSGTTVTVATGATDIVYADGGGAGANVASLGADLSGFLSASNNLSDLASAATALVNLGVTATAAELNILDGVTATTAELNILDGATVTAAELNILDGVTATAGEINYLDITTLGTSEASKAVTTDANGVTIFDAGVVEDETTVTSTSNAATINCRDGNVFTHELTENVTYTFSNPPASGRAFGFTLKIVQDSTARTITWPASVDWAGGEAPDAPASNEVNIYAFITHDGGTTWYGFLAGAALA